VTAKKRKFKKRILFEKKTTTKRNYKLSKCRKQNSAPNPNKLPFCSELRE
jgi:hypothetical protein